MLGLPGDAGRLAILRLNTARMPTVGVRLEELARETDGLSPADFVEALGRLRGGAVALAATG